MTDERSVDGSYVLKLLRRAEAAEAEVEIQDKQREKLITLHLEEEGKLKAEIVRLKETIERLKAEAGNYSEKEGYEIALKVAREENRVLKDEIVRLKYELEAIRD